MGRKILFITTDQQRYDTLGCNGGTLSRTPVVDGLAAAGILLSRRHIAALYYFSACLLAYALNLSASTNLWDYLLDPLVFGYALWVLLVKPACRLLQLRLSQRWKSSRRVKLADYTYNNSAITSLDSRLTHDDVHGALERANKETQIGVLEQLRNNTIANATVSLTVDTVASTVTLNTSLT